MLLLQTLRHVSGQASGSVVATANAKRQPVRCRARARLIVFKWTVGRFNYRAGSDSLMMPMTGSSIFYIQPRASGMKGRRRSRNIPMKNRNDPFM